MARALIIGGGAIGRGFLPWALQNLAFDIYDISENLCQSITSQGGYTSFMSKEGSLRKMICEPGKFTSKVSDLKLEEYAIAFVAVGPRNCSKLPREFSKLECPIFSLENDPSTVEELSQVFGSGKVLFGVPDVIASSTASPQNLSADSYALHTEDGVLYLENSDSLPAVLHNYLPEVIWSTRSDMIREWDAKLYLHNTAHCVAAFLGHLKGNTYLHESFDVPFITNAIDGVIEELVLALKRTTNYDHGFLENYADKELKRFSNKLLYDPILRVAREPLRKLAVGGRLTGALSMCMLAGVSPIYLNVGICAALQYKVTSDKDFQFMSQLSNFGVKNFLRYFLDLDPNSIESKYVVNSYEQTLKYIEEGIRCH